MKTWVAGIKEKTGHKNNSDLLAYAIQVSSKNAFAALSKALKIARKRCLEGVECISCLEINIVSSDYDKKRR